MQRKVLRLLFPQSASRFVQVRQVHAQLKLNLVILRLHISAELVKSLVVIAFLEVRQFVHRDHPQKFVGHVLEQGCDADFTLGFEPTTLNPRYRGVSPQCVLNHLEFAVKGHFGQGVSGGLKP